MKTTILLSLALAIGLGVSAQTVGQDAKTATQDTKTASEKGYDKTTGGVKKGYKKSTHATKKGVHKTATKVADKSSTT
ncbi:MAG: hypothetical protein M3Y72_26200 [Acidobacteriota bacterium]|nr:hypothetical protein [Acidobacteriota bacterium]